MHIFRLKICSLVPLFYSSFIIPLSSLPLLLFVPRYVKINSEAGIASHGVKNESLYREN